jgi:hypothetical protein
MTDYNASDREVSRAIRSWLHEDRHEDVSRIAGAVLDQVEATPRRRATWWPARRTLVMNKFVTLGLGAAAVVVLAVIAAQLLPGQGGTGGPGEEPSSSPQVSMAVSTPTPTPEPAPSVHGGLPEGPHILLTGEGEPSDVLIPKLTVTIPGPGWEGDAGAGILFRDVNEPVEDAGMNVFSQEEYLVFADPCNWESTTPVTVRTVDEFVAALAAQPGRDASEPVDITIDGYSGKAITLHIADDADFSDCDQNTFGTWDCFAPEAPRPCGFTGGPGETSVDYILDVDGALVAWHTGYQAGTPADIVAEQETLVLSATFGE